MRFQVSSAYDYDAECILEAYPKITENFIFEIENSKRKPFGNYYDELFIEINTLEELMKFKDVTCDSIIIDENNILTIYDGCVE